MVRGFPFIVARAAVIAACLALPVTELSAGPPYRTDDPEPTEIGHYEFYVLSSGLVSRTVNSGYLPGIELDYGLIPNGQLTIDTGVSFGTDPSGGFSYGYGDSALSFKYRFIQEDSNGWRPQVALFPAINLPTGDQARGLGAGHPAYFLPLWLQKSFGDWTTYGGGGYWFNQDTALGDKNYWVLGWLVQRKVMKNLSVAGELYFQTAPNVTGKESLSLDIGGIYDFDDHNHFVMSAGKDLLNSATITNGLYWYIAWKFTW